jgi:hypothetical protein
MSKHAVLIRDYLARSAGRHVNSTVGTIGHLDESRLKYLLKARQELGRPSVPSSERAFPRAAQARFLTHNINHLNVRFMALTAYHLLGCMPWSLAEL